MMFSDDLCETVSTISSAFTELEDDENGGDEREETREMKFVPVKTEIEELIPPGVPLTEDDIDDHFLNSFNTSGEGDGAEAGGGDDAALEELDLRGMDLPEVRRRRRLDPDDDPSDRNWATWKPKKKKPLPPGTARRGGGAKRGRSREQVMRERAERNKLAAKQKRANLPEEEKEKLKEKWRLEKQKSRKTVKARQEEEQSLLDLVEGDEPLVEEDYNRSSSRRPSRQAKNKPTIKEEPESAEEDLEDDFGDEDYKIEDDDDEDFRIGKKKRKVTARKSTGRAPRAPRTPRGPRTPRKKASEMTEEERQAQQEKWRKEAQERRARKRGSAVVKEEGDEDFGGGGDDDEDEDFEVTAKKRGGARRGRGRRRTSGGSSRSGSGGGASRRKKISEMTEDEREAIKRKWREEARLKRARQRETMTPQEREDYLRIQREKRREQRAVAKVTMSEQEREEENRKARERKKAKRALMTPEQRKEEAQKVTMRRIERLATMTDDEKKMWRMNNYLQNMARMGRMTPEELEHRRRQKLEYAKKRREKMTAEDLERRRLRIKAYRDSMSPERRARFLEKLRDGYRRRLERLKEDPDKWEEVKGKWKEDRLRRQKKMVEMGRNYVRKKHNLEASSSTPRRRYVRKVDPNETEEQRVQRIKESRRRTQKKIKLRKKLQMQKMLESGVSYDEIRQQVETPEQREKRLMRHRINRAKWNLRKRLEGVGAPPEEIEEKLKELHHTYTPTFNFRPYKPRPEAWKPIDPKDLELLAEDVEKKPEVGTSTSSTSIPSKVEVPEKLHTQQQQPKPKTPKAGTSKSSTATPGRRGRPPKIPQLLENQGLSVPATPVQQGGSTVIISRGGGGVGGAPGLTHAQVQFQPTSMGYPPQVSSPAGASTCSYVSAAETPEPIHYSTPQQQHGHLHQQFPGQQAHSHHHGGYQAQAPQYHFQAPASVVYPHQQPQTQPQSYSLQHILDSITFHESGSSSGPPISGSSSQMAYQQHPPHGAHHHLQTSHHHHPHHHTDTSSHHDYASSYDNHSPPPSSPPHSPPGGDHDDHDYGTSGAAGGGSGTTFGDLFNQPPPSSSNYSDSSIRKRGRPRKDEPPRPKKPKGSKCGHRPGPRGPKKSNKTNVIRDMVCDECGNAYNSSYLREHKNQFHNPNYKNQTCQLCGEKFNVARHWYTHYIRVHIGPTKEVKDKPHMCDACGQAFRQKNNLEKHKYYMHGEGLKKENFKKCPVCPGEKLFKETVSLYAHLRRKHPGFNRGGHDCYRCDQTFPDEKELGVHVRKEHDDSYFPCQYCNACRFTKWGLNFHYFRCTKISKDVRDQMRKSEGYFSLDRVPLPCEFCGRNVAVFSLTRHYWEMHNVKEDSFVCPECGKGFRVREFWAVHMEEKHLKTLDQMRELVRCLNVRSREGLVIKNPDGLKGGVPGNTPSKAAAQKRVELGVAKKGGRVKGQRVRGGEGKKGGRRKGKRSIVVTAEEEEGEEDEEMGVEVGGGRKRQILVVADEEEELRGLEGMDLAHAIAAKGGYSRKIWKGVGRKRKAGGGRRGRKKKVESEEEEDEDEEEEEEEEWRGSEEDEEEYQPRGRRRSSSRREETKKKKRRFIVQAESEEEEEETGGDQDQVEEEPEDFGGDEQERPDTPVDEDELLEAVVKQEVLSDDGDEEETQANEEDGGDEGEEEETQRVEVASGGGLVDN